MTFEECCIKCVENEELVNQFNRLTGCKLGVSKTPIEKIIDESCKYNSTKETFGIFCQFVFDHVWIPLLAKEQF